MDCVINVGSSWMVPVLVYTFCTTEELESMLNKRKELDHWMVQSATGMSWIQVSITLRS